MGRRKAVSKPEGEHDGTKRRRASAPYRNKKEKDRKGKSTGGGNAAEISKPEAPVAGVHPLLIPHVLENVFQHIICLETTAASNAKDVQNLRLVCKQWKDTATRVFRRNRAPMSFGKVGAPLIVSSEKDKMQSFLDAMKSSDLIPVQRYTFNPRFFVNENQQLMKDFLRICGPDAVELRLCWDDSCTMKFTPGSFPDLNLMKLKTLAFQCKHCVFFSNQGPTYDILEVFPSVAETLQELHLTFASDEAGGKWLQGMIKRLGECISKRIPKNVKILLHLNVPVSDLLLNTLTESELKLEELKLEFNVLSGVTSSEVIRKFFETQTATLKVLQILGRVGYGRHFPTISLEFPRLDELLHLDFGIRGATIQNLSFPDTFPKLTSLNIAEWLTESTYVESLNSTKTWMSLTEIHLPRRFSQAPLVKKAAQCFPNISKLHISSSRGISETLQEVFVYFEKVEELYITLPDQDPLDEFEDGFRVFFDADSVLSGVSPEDCRKVRRRRYFGNKRFKNVQHRPSILNLTNLKKLVLNGILLTDFSVRFVLLKMASLNELHINQSQISAKYVDLLRKKLSLKLIGYNGDFAHVHRVWLGPDDEDSDPDWPLGYEYDSD